MSGCKNTIYCVKKKLWVKEVSLLYTESKREDFRLIVEYVKDDIYIILLEYVRRNEKTYPNY